MKKIIGVNCHAVHSACGPRILDPLNPVFLLRLVHEATHKTPFLEKEDGVFVWGG
ncbi:MAG: hypothetical protein ABSE95_04105 [Thermodesulfobacteriota bacterium]|jgi:hypothetical protein